MMHHSTIGNRRGFTVVELMMVIAIVGVLVAIATPGYTQSLARYRASNAARKVAQDINITRARARAMSTSQSIVFSTNNSSYSITGMTDPEHPTSTYTVLLNNDPYKATMSGCTFSNNSTLTFNGYGSPSGAGTITLQVGAITKTISVDSDTGSVTIQ